jgi:hypothetical protein
VKTSHGDEEQKTADITIALRSQMALLACIRDPPKVLRPFADLPAYIP